MATDRYQQSPIISFGYQYGTSTIHIAIRNAVKNGLISYEERVLGGRERLDTIAGEVYKDGRYWWIIAAASNIGWGLQVPPGTVIRIPDLKSVLNLVS